jgi:hypothetical protein
MRQSIDIILSPEHAADHERVRKAISRKLRTTKEFYFSIRKRSIDARSKNVKMRLQIEVSDQPIEQLQLHIPQYPSVKHKKHVVIAGSGPAGLFAALTLIERGIKPILFERGKNVRERRFDIAAISKEGIVNTNSNYCFGEGGAGTYSDGKLYTRSNKRGNVKKILETFVRFGADNNILTDAHPHIGTNKLPGIISAMRNVIKNAGGEIFFNTRITAIETAFDTIQSVTVNDEKIQTSQCILATGHSARDMFTLLHEKGIFIEAKPVAMGIRIEHPQHIIDHMQYHCADRGKFLPPASYAFVQQVSGRGVYSFCMCPGGIIAPCATEPDQVVTNGWSPSKRNNPFANAGFVVNIGTQDTRQFETSGPLAGMLFQKAVEQACFTAGGGKQVAPAQRMVDFVNKTVSGSLPVTSYKPGLRPVLLDDVLPACITVALRSALLALKKSKPAFFTNDAICVAVESRTSSPVRITRNANTTEHVQIKGLYPCGEGAGYAGGIVSAAMDGVKVAQNLRM